MNLVSFLGLFGLLLIAMSIHEFAHSWTAYKLGDMTAKYSGRLTLNPLAHIDPLGTILLPIFLFITTGGQFVFGAAKPVPINYQALKNPKRDIIWVGASGPLANFIFAFFLSIFWKPVLSRWFINPIFETLIFINVILGVFNLLPIPPLDGSRILMGILPVGLSSKYARLEPYGFIIVILLMGLGIFNLIIEPIIKLILSWLGIVF